VTVFWGTKRALLGPLGVWTYSDILLSVLDDASWTTFAGTLSRGLTAEEVSERDGIAPDPESLRLDAERYRRAYHLLTVEELDEWLASQHLPIEEWERYLARRVLMSQLPPDRLGPPQDLSSTPRFGDAFFAEALCSLFLPGARDAFRERLLLAAESGRLIEVEAPDAPAIVGRYPWLREVSRESLGRVRSVLVTSQERLKALTTEARVRSVIEQRRLDWVRLVAEVFLASDRAVACEVVRCLRQEGGRFMNRAPRLRNVIQQSRSFLLEETGALNEHFVGASPTEIKGPFPDGEHHAVYWIAERHVPDDSDPEIRARAVACVERSILKVAGSVAREEDRVFHG
jgi:hypothetical protein